MKKYLYCSSITICFFVFGISTASIARTNLNFEGLAGSLLNSVLNPVPAPKHYGKTYTTDASPSAYRYVIFERGIRDEDLRVLEQILSQKGYYVLGRNSSYKQKGTLRVECRVDDEYESKYSSEMRKVYKYSARCELLDVNRDDFIVYSGQGELYGAGENARGQALSLALYQLNSSAQLHPVSFDVKGVDDGKKTSRQKDRDEAILDAKYQALAKTGSEISNLERYRLELSEGKISQDSYRQEIEERSTGRFLPDCKVEELGYIDGAYTVRFIGSIVPDPIGSIETSPQPAAQNQFVAAARPVRANTTKHINTTLEIIPTGEAAKWKEGGRQYKMQILNTYTASGMPCRKYTLQVDGQQNMSTHTSCRNQYGVWQNQ